MISTVSGLPLINYVDVRVHPSHQETQVKALYWGDFGMFWEVVPVHHHAMNAGFDIPCLDRFFSRPFWVHTVNLRLRNMRMRAFVCVSLPIYRGAMPRMAFVIFKQGANEDSVGSIHARDMDIVRDAAEWYVLIMLWWIYRCIYLACDRLIAHLPRWHSNNRPIRSLHRGICVVSDLQYPSGNQARPFLRQVKDYYGFRGMLGTPSATIERVCVHVNEYLMEPAIAVPALNRLLSSASSAVVYSTYDFTTGFCYRVFVARGSTARGCEIVLLRVLPSTGWFVDVEDTYRNIAWRELHG